MKKENKSLFLYTALIFLISIIMILIAFVGQNNTQSMQPETDNSGQTISDKVDQLSEENRLLLEERITLTRENEALRAESETIKNENEIDNTLLNISKLLTEENSDVAKLLYDSLNYEELNELQKAFYDNLTQNFN